MKVMITHIIKKWERDSKSGVIKRRHQSRKQIEENNGNQMHFACGQGDNDDRYRMKINSNQKFKWMRVNSIIRPEFCDHTYGTVDDFLNFAPHLQL